MHPAMNPPAMNPAVTNPLERLIAHRGWPEAYPENSLRGMRAVLEAGARHVEFDLQLTRDGHPVVLHDDDLQRVSGRTGVVTALEHQQLSGYAAGEPDRFGERFADEPIPDLEAMLARIAGFPVDRVFVEIKQRSLEAFGRDRVLESIAPVLARFQLPLVILSFDARVLPLARKRLGLPIGWVAKPWSQRVRRRAEALAPEYLFMNARRVPEGPAPFWPGDWQWAIYTVNRVETARDLLERGAELVETDRWPGLAAELAPAMGGADD